MVTNTLQLLQSDIVEVSQSISEITYTALAVEP